MRPYSRPRNYRHFDFVVIDIKMPYGTLFDSFESVGGTKTGVLLANDLLNDVPDSTFVALTNSDRADDHAWFEAHDFEYHVKRNIEPARFATYLRRRALREKPKVFIVHGHDLRAVRELKRTKGLFAACSEVRGTRCAMGEEVWRHDRD
jgi:CheY-like chemotaxis protein